MQEIAGPQVVREPHKWLLCPPPADQLVLICMQKIATERHCWSSSGAEGMTTNYTAFLNMQLRFMKSSVFDPNVAAQNAESFNNSSTGRGVHEDEPCPQSIERLVWRALKTWYKLGQRLLWWSCQCSSSAWCSLARRPRSFSYKHQHRRIELRGSEKIGRTRCWLIGAWKLRERPLATDDLSQPWK